MDAGSAGEAAFVIPAAAGQQTQISQAPRAMALADHLGSGPLKQAIALRHKCVLHSAFSLPSFVSTFQAFIISISASHLSLSRQVLSLFNCSHKFCCECRACCDREIGPEITFLSLVLKFSVFKPPFAPVHSKGTHRIARPIIQLNECKHVQIFPGSSSVPVHVKASH